MDSDGDDGGEDFDLTLMAPAAVLRLGGRITRFPIEFSLDGKLYFVCVAKNIIMHSVKTGERVGILTGHTATVVGVFRNTQNKLQIYSGSHDGTVKVWDFYEEQCLKTYDIGAPIHHFVLAQQNKLFLHVHKESNSPGKPEQLIAYSLTKNTMQTCFKSKGCKGMAVSDNGGFVAFIDGKILSIWDVLKKKQIKCVHPQPLTCVCFHPNDAYLATGDQKGEITLWYRYDNPRKLVTTKMHWHAHPVSSVSFSTDGGYLLSGGEEMVLVMWQIETGHKHFLPRLGSTINFIRISPDANLYALSCADNTLRFINATSSTVQREVRGLQHAHGHQMSKQARALQTGLIVEPRNNLLVLNGMPGEVQFYDPFSDRHMMRHRVVERNVVSRTDTSHLSSSTVQHVTFSRDGHWMVTLDRRINCETSDSRSLKFWCFDTASASYLLNTLVPGPHKDKVLALRFHPTTNIVVTVAADRTFKLWHSVERKEAVGVTTPIMSPFRTSWTCQAVRSYRGFRPQTCSFSADGSLLAVSFGQVVTLWDPQTALLRHALVHPPPSDQVRWLGFVASSPFLVVGTPHALYVWNVLTGTVWWSVSLPLAGLTVDASSPHLAVVARAPDPVAERVELGPEPEFDSRKAEKRWRKQRRAAVRKLKDARRTQHAETHLILFKADSPLPLRMWRVHDIRLEKEGGYYNSSVTFLARRDIDDSSGFKQRRKQERARSLMFLTVHKQLARVDNLFDDIARGTQADPELNSALQSVRQVEPLSLFEQIYGTQKQQTQTQQPALALTQTQTQTQYQDAKKGALSLLAAPVHVLPPISKLYGPLLQQFLLPAKDLPGAGGDPLDANAANASKEQKMSSNITTTFDDEGLFLQHGGGSMRTPPALAKMYMSIFSQ